jgi:hypothetical protein
MWTRKSCMPVLFSFGCICVAFSTRLTHSQCHALCYEMGRITAWMSRRREKIASLGRSSM